MSNFKITWKVLIVVIALLLISCDPFKILVIKANDMPNVSVTIYYSQDYLLNQGVNSESKNAILRIPSIETAINRDTVIFYGLGGWGKSFPEIYNDIDSIVIVNTDGTIILDNQLEMDNYFVKNRHGYAKRILKIEAK